MGHGAPAASARGQQPMDHSRMTMGARAAAPSTAMRGMDRSRMAGMQQGSVRQAPGAGMQGMQHGNMPAMKAVAGAERTPALLPADAGTEKLLALVRELVRDPAVREQIQQDPALREAWADPGVREIILRRP
jgi:hypothetical protein